MAKDEMTQKDKEEEAASGPAGILSSVLGLAAPLAGMIPSLIRNPQADALKRYQRGQGAGASLARRTASEAARRVVGAAGQRGGSGALREGLRAADEITQRGAAQAATTGAREGLAATQMLRANEQNRMKAFQKFGGAAGAGLSTLAAGLASSRDQGPVDRTKGLQADGTVTGQGADETGLGQPMGGSFTGGPRAAFGETIEKGRAGLDRIAMHPTTVRQTSAPTGRFSGEGGITDEFSKAREQGAAQAQITPQDAVQQRQAENLQNIAQTTAEKQDAASLAAIMSGTAGEVTAPAPPTPPPMTDPAMVEQWVYEQVANYMPGPVEQGLTPEQAAQILIQFGFTPDYGRLGGTPLMQPPEGEKAR